MKKENNYNILNEEEFKSYVVEKMDSVAKALHEISHGMVKFKTEYFDAINKNIKTISEEEDKLKWRMERGLNWPIRCSGPKCLEVSPPLLEF